MVVLTLSIGDNHEHPRNHYSDNSNNYTDEVASMTKTQQIIEHVVVTFVEAGVAYVIVIPHPQFNKTVVAGAIGAGLSAVYNVLRQSQPTIIEPILPVTGLKPQITIPEQSMNGVSQLIQSESVVSPQVPPQT